ncbi:MAG: SUMF1/EgtB/PvdO family nonheme iron enzyme [Candidatus Hydrogenedentes bacterium]|nr:SUMF1/EgtB/PvdO family nonheme iron enzyme [Candidatus Hydrogenedentota bacterium]
MSRGPIAAVAVVMTLVCVVSAAQDRGGGGTAAPPPGGSGSARVALVVGNAAYPDSPLRNPVNDATDMAAALERLGFAVMLQSDVDQQRIETAIREFGDRIAGAAAALFYYAGHGIQVEGHNYLVPVGKAIEAEHEAKYFCVDAGLVLEKMQDAGARVNIVILDACRNNPFARSWRSSTQGLAPMEAARGCLIAYATAPGKVAADGTGRNSVYTASLLKHLEQNDLDILKLFMTVRNEVLQATDDAQIPWENTSLTAEFYFVARPYVTGPGAGETRPPTVVAPTSPPAEEPNPGELCMFEGGEFAWIPPGNFEMGSSLTPEQVITMCDGYKEVQSELENEHPQHAVTLTRGFWMGTREVSVDRFRTFVDATGYETDAEKAGQGAVYDIEEHGWLLSAGATWRNPHREVEEREPVVLVSWNDATAYCQWLSQKTGDTYRLPTEAEWEYACRAGTNTECWWGDRIEDGTGCMNCADETKRPDGKQWVWRLPFSDGYWNVSPVGSFKANPWGLYDTIGNVWEWCADLYGGYPSETTTDPKGARTGDYRVTRGGSWGCFPWGCRSACRDYQSAKNAADSLGFRVVRLAYP